MCLQFHVPALAAAAVALCSLPTAETPRAVKGDPRESPGGPARVILPSPEAGPRLPNPPRFVVPAPDAGARDAPSLFSNPVLRDADRRAFRNQYPLLRPADRIQVIPAPGVRPFSPPEVMDGTRNEAPTASESG